MNAGGNFFVLNGVIFYYSSTGNTKLACRYIEKNLVDAKVDLFNMTHKEIPDLSHYDFVGFATFTDWGEPPLFVKLFIDKIPEQNGKPAFLFNTCAAMSGKTLTTLKTWVSEKCFKIVAAFTLYAPESYPPSIVRGITKEHNPSLRNLKRFNTFLKELNSLLTNSDYKDLKEIKIKTGIIGTLVPRFPRTKSKLEMGKKYVNQSLCTQCGICVTGCPNEAISLDSGVNFDEDKCYGCWSCFNHCPQKAVYTEKINGIGHYSGPLQNYRQKLYFSS